MKKRFVSLLLLCSVLTAVGCGGNSDSGNSTTGGDNPDATISGGEAELTEKELYPLPDKDMEGFELRFYNFDDSFLNWAINPLDAEEENGDNVNDAIYRRNRKIEGMYNCNITELTVSNPITGLRDIIYSGDDMFDIAMIYDESVASAYCEGLLSTWDRLDYAMLDRSWWNQNANDVFQIQGKQFAAVGDFTLGMVSRGFVMLFNKEMIESANLDVSLYDLVRQGDWTLDKFAEIAKLFVKDVNGDSVFDEKDQYGTTGAIKLHFGALVTGSGVKYISVNNDGIPYFAIPGNSYAMDVFEKILNLHNGSNIFYTINKNDVHNGSTEGREMFKSGLTAFYGTSMKSISLYRDTSFDIGILPFPKYDSEQEEYYILTSGAGVATIPITLPEERDENVGILLDALCRDSQDNLLPTYREVVLKTKYTRDEDSADMLDIIFKSCTYDLGLSVWPGNTYYKYMENYLRMTDNFASMTATLEPLVEKDINTMLATLENNS